MSDHQNISVEELELYLKGELRDERAKLIYKSLNEDEHLRRVYEGIKQFRLKEEQSIQDFEREVKKKADLDAPFKNKHRGRKQVNYLISLSVAAGAALFIGLYFYDPRPSPNEYDFTDAGVQVTLSLSERHLADAMNAYKTGNYEEASKILAGQLIEHPSNDTLLYYLGVIAKEENNYDEALLYFMQIEKNQSFYMKAEYQLGLTHWYMGDEQKAIELFTNISRNKKHPFREKAQAAVEALR